jgi:hypothetical protein
MPFYRGDPNRNWPVGKSRRPEDYRKEVPVKFSSTAIDKANYNPKITYYYNVNDVVIKIEEVYEDYKFIQTISGTGDYSDQAVSYYAIHGAWVQTTVS